MDKYNCCRKNPHTLNVEIIYHHGTKDIDFTCDYGTEIKINGLPYYQGDEYHDSMYARTEDLTHMCKFLLKNNIIQDYTINKIYLNDEPEWDYV